MRNRLLTLSLTLLTLHGCADTSEEFPREVFSDAYAAAIDQGFVEAVILSTADFVTQNRQEEDLGARVQRNLPDETCFSADTPSAEMLTLAFDGVCQISGREWSGEITYEAIADSESGEAFALTYAAVVEDRALTGVVEVTITNTNPDTAARGSLTTSDIAVDGVVANYETQLDFVFGSVRADNEDLIEGYRISGDASWNNAAGNLWSSAMRQTLVRPDSNVPHSGTRLFNVDGNVEFQMLVNAITADSTGIVLRTGSNDLRICVDENESEACPSS